MTAGAASRADAGRVVAIDCFPASVARYSGFTIVAVDVIRATTTAVTAMSLGRRCFPVPSIPEAMALAAILDDALLAGELHGDQPDGFDIGNSPSALVDREDSQRPLVLLSTSGTDLVCSAAARADTYVACLRNWTATVDQLAGRVDRIAVIGAGSRGEFREEDQLGCAWIAAGLLERGYSAADDDTRAVVQRWGGSPVEAALRGHSADYLVRSGQAADLDFVASHVDDVASAHRIDGHELVAATRADGRAIGVVG